MPPSGTHTTASTQHSLWAGHRRRGLTGDGGSDTTFIHAVVAAERDGMRAARTDTRGARWAYELRLSRMLLQEAQLCNGARMSSSLNVECGVSGVVVAYFLDPSVSYGRSNPCPRTALSPYSPTVLHARGL
uniref:Uncharacterized protein n=1 Tax=Mycena chlorophos TaxID=658473 RepID=A0ABQ0LIC5_MYCCL|nr:predicted protein [Mycena chlorophos]